MDPKPYAAAFNRFTSSITYARALSLAYFAFFRAGRTNVDIPTRNESFVTLLYVPALLGLIAFMAWRSMRGKDARSDAEPAVRVHALEHHMPSARDVAAAQAAAAQTEAERYRAYHETKSQSSGRL